MQDRAVSRIYGFFLTIFVVLGLMALAAFRNISRSVTTSDWVNHTHATIYEFDQVLASAIAGDGAMRTFVWTGDPREQGLARDEFGSMSEHLEIAKALTRDDPAVHEQVLELERVAGQHAAAALALAGTRENVPRGNRPELVPADPGLETMREIKRRVAKIRSGQFELLSRRDHEAYLQAQSTRWVVGTGVALDLVLFAAVAWLIRDDIGARRRLAASLQGANEALETRVRERTAELAAANARLSAENLERQWAAQSLEHQLRYNQVVVNAVNELVFVVTKALKITRINPAVVQRSGWDEPEILGRPLMEFVRVGPDPGPEALAQALRSGREIRVPAAELLSKGRGATAASFTLLPLRDSDQVVGGVVILQVLTPG